MDDEQIETIRGGSEDNAVHAEGSAGELSMAGGEHPCDLGDGAGRQTAEVVGQGTELNSLRQELGQWRERALRAEQRVEELLGFGSGTSVAATSVLRTSVTGTPGRGGRNHLPMTMRIPTNTGSLDYFGQIIR